MTEKCRFENFSVHRRIKKEIDGFTIHENVIKRDDRDYLFLHNLEDCKDVANVLSVYHHNCVGLMKENEQLKQYISKIDFAIIRKYDNSLENLLDEIYDGEYENWIKKQVSRAKKLDGDVK